MIKEALQLILSETRAGSNPTPHIRNVGRNKRAVCLNGEETVEELEPPRLHRSVCTLDSFERLVTSRRMDKSVTVYVNSSGITAILDEDETQEKIRLPIRTSQESKTVFSLKEGRSPKDLVRLLRTKLAGCVKHESIISLLRSIKFDTMRSSRGTTHAQDESMGKSVQKSVLSHAGDLPETLTIDFPLFDSPSDVRSVVSVQFAVIINYDAETIALEPLEYSYQDAMARASYGVVESVRDILPDVCVVQGAIQEDM